MVHRQRFLGNTQIFGGIGQTHSMPISFTFLHQIAKWMEEAKQALYS